jgi:hypothetical protein
MKRGQRQGLCPKDHNHAGPCSTLREVCRASLSIWALWASNTGECVRDKGHSGKCSYKRRRCDVAIECEATP